MNDTHALQPQNIDTLINARWVLPVVPRGKVFENCSVAVHRGEIIALVPTATATNRFSANETLELNKHVVMPGLVNAHCHAAMSLMRGFADDLPLDCWLKDHIWPAENKWVTPGFVADGVELAIAEMLESGTTCFSDMYYFPEQTAEIAHRVGIHCQVAFPVLDFATAWATNADECIRKGLALHDTYRSIDLIDLGFGPHASATVSDAALKRIATLAGELQVPVHIHLHETEAELEASLKSRRKRPIEHLFDLNLLTPQTRCVHMTQLVDSDIELLQRTGAGVVHCPQSNLKFASGLCPVQTLLDAGVNVGLGTDGAASNNGLQMLAELNVAALIGKIAAGDAAAVSATDALTMATLGSARVLGLGDRIGSIEPGKQADLTAIEFTGAGAEPIYDVASHLAYNNRNTRVSHTWVKGQCLFARGQHRTIELAELHNKARAWRAKLKPMMED